MQGSLLGMVSHRRPIMTTGKKRLLEYRTLGYGHSEYSVR